MKQTTAAGIGLAVVLLLLGVIMEGGNPASFINIPAFLIVMGGTTGALLACISMKEAVAMPKLMIYALKGGNDVDHKGAVTRMTALSEKARREGLLALEGQLEEIPDDYTRKGVQLVVDGTDSHTVEAILRSEIDGMTQRHGRNAKLFATAAGLAPTLGVLGTVMSLVHVLENLADPGALGHSIAGAFIATLYGVGSANVLFFPISNRLKALSEEEVTYREMILEGVLAIQAGDNPRVLQERLETYLEPSARGAEADPDAGNKAAGSGEASLKEAA
jgi:chemotaxis protein MotA